MKDRYDIIEVKNNIRNDIRSAVGILDKIAYIFEFFSDWNEQIQISLIRTVLDKGEVNYWFHIKFLKDGFTFTDLDVLPFKQKIKALGIKFSQMGIDKDDNKFYMDFLIWRY